TYYALEKDKKEMGSLERQKQTDKRVAKREAELRNYNQKLTILRSRSMIMLTLVMLGLHMYLSRTYSGIVVAKLPFQPLSFFQKLTHRTLEGDDFTDCSFVSHSPSGFCVLPVSWWWLFLLLFAARTCVYVFAGGGGK